MKLLYKNISILGHVIYGKVRNVRKVIENPDSGYIY